MRTATTYRLVWHELMSRSNNGHPVGQFNRNNDRPEVGVSVEIGAAFAPLIFFRSWLVLARVYHCAPTGCFAQIMHERLTVKISPQ